MERQKQPVERQGSTPLAACAGKAGPDVLVLQMIGRAGAGCTASADWWVSSSTNSSSRVASAAETAGRERVGMRQQQQQRQRNVLQQMMRQHQKVRRCESGGEHYRKQEVARAPSGGLAQSEIEFSEMPYSATTV